MFVIILKEKKFQETCIYVKGKINGIMALSKHQICKYIHRIQWTK